MRSVAVSALRMRASREPSADRMRSSFEAGDDDATDAGAEECEGDASDDRDEANEETGNFCKTSGVDPD